MSTVKNKQSDFSPGQAAQTTKFESPTFLEQVGGFTPVIDIVVRDIGRVGALVYGQVWRFCQMEDGVCKASKKRIAERIGVTPRTVRRYVSELCEKGYLVDLTPDRRFRPHVYRDTGLEVIRRLLAEEAATKARSDIIGADGQPFTLGTTKGPGPATIVPTGSDTVSDKDSREESREDSNSKKGEQYPRKPTLVGFRASSCDVSEDDRGYHKSEKELAAAKTPIAGDADSLSVYAKLLEYGVKRNHAYQVSETYSRWYIKWWLDWALENRKGPGLLVKCIRSDDPPPSDGFFGFARDRLLTWGLDDREAVGLAVWGDGLTWNALRSDALAKKEDPKDAVLRVFRWRSENFKNPDAEAAHSVYVCRHELILELIGLLDEYDVSIPSVNFGRDSLAILAEKLAQCAMEHGRQDQLEHVRRYLPELV